MNKPGTFKFQCPSCGRSIRAASRYVGRMISCPGCKVSFAVPKDADPSETMLVPGIEREEARRLLGAPPCAEPDPEEAAVFELTGHSTPPDPEWIGVRCGNCGQEGEVPNRFAGKRIKCLACGKEVFVGTYGFAAVDESREMRAPPKSPDSAPSRFTAGMFAFFLGALGIHKFYMGYGKEGFLMHVIGVCTCGYGYILMAILGAIEALSYWTMSDRDFYEIYVAGRRGWF